LNFFKTLNCFIRAAIIKVSFNMKDDGYIMIGKDYIEKLVVDDFQGDLYSIKFLNSLRNISEMVRSTNWIII